MAKRTNRPNHNDSCREKIQTSQLINRLQNHIFNHDGNPEFKKHNMNPSQVKAAETLLKKTLPDLATVQNVEGSQKSLEDHLTELDDG